MTAEHVFDLARVDVVAAADDELLGPADYAQVARVIEIADVAGPEVALLGERRRRRLGEVEIAAEHVGTLDEDLRALLLEANFDARQRHADGSRAPLALVGVGNEHEGLGHPVALEHDLAGALTDGLVQLGA